MPGPDLIDRGLVGVEGHQVGVFPTYFPTSIVGVDCWGVLDGGAQLLVGGAHWARGLAQGILGDGSLGQLEPSQSFQHRRYFAHWDADLVVQGVGRHHRALSHPVGGGAVLVGCQIEVLSSDFAAAPSAPADPHSVLSYFGLGQERKVGDVGQVYALFHQSAPAARAGFQGNRHFYWRLSDLTGVRR